MNAILTARPELALFAALSIGYGVGGIRIGQFSLGGVAGTLLAALAIGQIGVPVDAGLQRFMFTLFVYALGFSVAPSFFASIDKTTWRWTLLVVIEVVFLVVVVFVAAWIFKLDVGTASGLLSGAATESAMVGTTSEAIGRAAKTDLKLLQANVASAYALSYVFSLMTIVLFASQIAPRLLGIDLKKAARQALVKLGGAGSDLDPDQSAAFPSLVRRGFSVSTANGQSVASLEIALGGDATIEGVRRHGIAVGVTDDLVLQAADEVSLVGQRSPISDAVHLVGDEIADPSGLSFTVETRNIVLTRWPPERAPISEIAALLHAAGVRGVYLAGTMRDDRHYAVIPGATVRRGDVVRMFGKPDDVARAATVLGVASMPSPVTDFIYLGAGLIVGILIGMITIPILGAAVSLGSAGALLSGLGFGWLRARRLTFGAFPAAAMSILKDLGLAVFIASIGLSAGPSVLALLAARGWQLPVASIVITLIPASVSLFVGHVLLKMDPAILCGAIAGQHASTPAINATEAVAGNSIPVIGYTVTYAMANIALPLTGPFFVAAFEAIFGVRIAS